MQKLFFLFLVLCFGLTSQRSFAYQARCISLYEADSLNSILREMLSEAAQLNYKDLTAASTISIWNNRLSQINWDTYSIQDLKNEAKPNLQLLWSLQTKIH